MNESTAFGPGAEPAEVKTEQFRIGCRYRQNNGRVVLLEAVPEWSDLNVRTAQAYGVPLSEIAAVSGGDIGWRLLSTGRTMKDRGPDYPANLVPGEVDEQGDPLTPATMKAEDEPTALSARCVCGYAFGAHWLGCCPGGGAFRFAGEYSRTEPVRAFKNEPVAAEPVEKPREPLTWNKRPILDRWPGFVTHKRMPDVQTAPTLPEQRLAQANAQIDPGHAMAAVRQLVG